VTFTPGTKVRVRPGDPDHHTRLPRYVHGCVGEVVEAEGTHRLPDDSARRLPAPRTGIVYAVRFDARDLWGSGDHTVVLNLWDAYLEEVG
jgi:nitrile hydratase subunit beta